jgi:hypothetical protein
MSALLMIPLGHFSALPFGRILSSQGQSQAVEPVNLPELLESDTIFDQCQGIVYMSESFLEPCQCSVGAIGFG